MLNLFLQFFKIGITAFGGGAVIISLIQKEFVDTGIISTTEFARVLSLSQATPGPIAGSAATYIGFKLYGLIGIFLANIAIALPSFFIVMLFSNILSKAKDHDAVDDTFKILRPVTAAIIFSVVLFLMNISIFNSVKMSSFYDIMSNVNLNALLIFCVSLFFMLKSKLNPVYIALVSGLLGALIL